MKIIDLREEKRGVNGLEKIKRKSIFTYHPLIQGNILRDIRCLIYIH